MTRTNYRVLAYYREAWAYDNTECYISIINAKSKLDVVNYFDSTDLYYEILNEQECDCIEDVRKADSVLIEGVRIYSNNVAYEKAIALLGVINMA